MSDQPWNAGRLLEISGSYWQTCALHAAVKLDIFSALAAGAAPVAELAARTGTDSRALGMLLNSLCAMGLLEKREGDYANTEPAAELLVRASPHYLGHILLHHHDLMESWAHLDQAVRSGEPTRRRDSHGVDSQRREDFLMGMFNLAMRLAPQIVPQIDLGGRRRLLDLGGGPGTYAIHFCQANPGLQATVYDLPTTRPFAEKTIARFGLSDRITFRDGDFIQKGIEGSYDVAWLSHILHGEGPAGCATILDKAVSALEPGGMILVQEFVLDNDEAGPLFPALFSLNMLLGTPRGQAYSERQLMEMLSAAGAGEVRRLPIAAQGETGIIAGRV